MALEFGSGNLHPENGRKIMSLGYVAELKDVAPGSVVAFPNDGSPTIGVVYTNKSDPNSRRVLVSEPGKINSKMVHEGVYVVNDVYFDLEISSISSGFEPPAGSLVIEGNNKYIVLNNIITGGTSAINIETGTLEPIIGSYYTFFRKWKIFKRSADATKGDEILVSSP